MALLLVELSLVPKTLPFARQLQFSSVLINTTHPPTVYTFSSFHSQLFTLFLVPITSRFARPNQPSFNLSFLSPLLRPSRPTPPESQHHDTHFSKCQDNRRLPFTSLNSLSRDCPPILPIMSEKSKERDYSPSNDLPPIYARTTSGSSKSARLAAMFGGKDVEIGPRIIPVPDYLKTDGDDSEETSSAILDRQLAAEDGASIQYRTCSWQKTAALLFSEYICLAIMSFPWSYSILGLVPGIILTVVVAGLVLYTSLILWQFCLRHPEVRDVCDIGQTLFTFKRAPWLGVFAWWATAVMFILNNTFIQALHVLVGAEYLNTMTASDFIGGCRTVEFSVIVTVICWLASLPRTFSMMSKLGTASAVFTFISVVLATIFVGIQGNPAHFDLDGKGPDPHGAVIFNIIPERGTTWVNGMAAFLNISYTFIGQITLPSFIAEMRDPR